MRIAIRRTRVAQAEIEEAAAYYDERGGEELMERFVGALDRVLSQIAEHPGIGRRAEFADPSLKDVRVIHLGDGFEKWLIFYKPIPAALLILHVVHGARNLPAHFKPPDWDELP